MLRRFAGYYRPHIKMFIADMVCALTLAVCDLIYPMITRSMLNNYIPNGNMKWLLLLAALLLGIYLFKMLLNYFVNYYGHKVGVDIQADMRREVFCHLQKLPLTYFDNNKTGTIMSRIVTDLFDLSELAHHGPEDLFISAITIIGSFIVMSSINIWLALIIVICVPVMVFFTAKKRLLLSKTAKETRVEIGEVTANLENSISGIRLSKAYTNEEYENSQFEKGNDRFVKARGRQYKVMAEFISGNTFLNDILYVVMYVSGGLFCFFGKITIADFTAFVLYINVFSSPIRKLINFVEQYQSGMTGFERFCEIMDYPAEKDAEGASELIVTEGRVEFNNVSFSYGTKREILHDLSFVIEPGKKLALVGPSGGGKTTICHLLPRFYSVDSGYISIDGQKIEDVTVDSLRKNIGIVAQDVFLFNATIYDNIAYGYPGATEKEVEEAAKKANIYDFIMSLENGFGTEVGERGVKLSGGQKQRISIARVFLKNPSILILDEATSALDNMSEIMIQKSLDELCKGRTTIVVAHRLTTVKNADEILVVTDDGIVERGTHNELLEKDGLYSELWKGYKE